MEALLVRLRPETKVLLEKEKDKTGLSMSRIIDLHINDYLRDKHRTVNDKLDRMMGSNSQ
jgi:hypothetical protein